MSDNERSASPAGGADERDGSAEKAGSGAEGSPVVANGRSPSRSVSRSRSRSRSRSKSRKHKKRRHYSRSRSRSRSPKRSSRRRSRSRSRSYDRGGRGGGYRSSPPRGRGGGGYGGGGRGRYGGGAAPGSDNVPPNRCVGVFGMSLYTNERDLKEFFGKFGPIEDIQLVYDHPTGRSRGFGFVYFENVEDAIEAKERGAGAELDGHRIRVDFSATQRAHTPTPGIYMGRPDRGYRGGGGGGYREREREYYRRSPSPYYGRRRSRSVSYSPPPPRGGRRDYY